MDNYTKMCDCPEMQNGWVPKIGDWTDKGLIVSISKRYIESRNLRPFPQLSIKNQSVVNKDKDNVIYLPSIEQLMGMVWNKEEEDPGHLMGRIGDFFYSDKYTGDPDSMRELWLAFVMHECYDLKWSGTEWTKGG